MKKVGSVLLGLLFVSLPWAGKASGLVFPVGDREIEVEGSLEGRAVVATESGSPDEDPRALLKVGLGSDLGRDLRFEGRLVGQAGGSPRHADGFGFFGYEDAIQDISPSLSVPEVFLEYFSELADLRAGLLRFAWGKLDGEQPNDLLNPEAYYDPVLMDEADRKIGIPAVSAVIHLPRGLELTAVGVPVATSFRFPDIDERWYPPVARVPPESESEGFTVRNDSRIRNGSIPARTLRNGAAGFRLSGYGSGADYSFYYFDGFDPGPAFEVEARGFIRLNPGSPQGFDVRSEVEIFPVYDRIRSVGADLAWSVLGLFTLRAEAAWIDGRLYPRAVGEIVNQEEVDVTGLDPVLLATGQEQEVPVTLPPVNVERDAVEWGIGADWIWNQLFALLQVSQTLVLDNEVDLLISDTETRVALNLRRTFLADRLTAELVGAWGVQGVYGLAQAEVGYQATGSTDFHGGYLLIEGKEDSFVGQYHRNDQLYGGLRYRF